MADPRIQRTKDHVLAVARRLLSEPSEVPLTFTTLAAEAQVSRRTLYTHWGSIDRVIADTVTDGFVPDDVDLSSLDLTERARNFLMLVRNRVADPISSVAAIGLMSRATHDPEAVAALAAMVERGRAEFSEHVCHVTPEQYDLVVGPIFHAEYFTRSRMTDDQIESLSQLAVSVLQPYGQETA